MHRQVTTLVNNYYRINSKLPDFADLDDMWIAVSDKINDPQVRGRLRQVKCQGYMRQPDSSIYVLLGIPDHVRTSMGDDD